MGFFRNDNGNETDQSTAYSDYCSADRAATDQSVEMDVDSYSNGGDGSTTGPMSYDPSFQRDNTAALESIAETDNRTVEPSEAETSAGDNTGRLLNNGYGENSDGAMVGGVKEAKSELTDAEDSAIEVDIDGSVDGDEDIREIDPDEATEMAKNGTSDEEGGDLEEEEFTRNVGDLNCWYAPFLVRGVGDFCKRTYDWTLLNKEQVSSALTVSVAQVPEAITCALIAGVDPVVALQSTWIMNVVTSLVGGRPGMISGASTTIAIVLKDLVEDHGVNYVFYAVMLAGALQVIVGLVGMDKVARLIPHSVVVGFMNAAGLLLVATQFRYAKVFPDQAFDSNQRVLLEVGYSWEQLTDNGSTWVGTSTFIVMLIEALLSFLLCLAFSRIPVRWIPGPLIAMILVTGVEWVIVRKIGYESPLIEDYGMVESSLPKPVFLDSSGYDLPSIFDWDNFKKIYLTGIAVFGVSTTESLMTLNVVDMLDQTRGLTKRVAVGQGVANVASGLFGGMGGSGLAGQSMIANKMYGVTNLSTFLAGAFMLLFISVAYTAVNKIPLAAVAGVMVYAAFNLIWWQSLLVVVSAMLPQRLRDRLHLDYKVQRTETAVMLIIMAVSIIFNIGIAVVSGIIIAVFLYAWDSSRRVVVDKEVSEDEKTVTYNVSGPLFFGTAHSIIDTFTADELWSGPEEVYINLEGAEVFDWSGMTALRTVYDRFSEAGKTVVISSLTPSSRRLMEKNASMWTGVNFLEMEEVRDVEYGESKDFSVNISFHSDTASKEGRHGV